ncbi:hypothetical protein NE237_002125 [Protea cynaroides]|uniref:VQ domain-containing protein n=1 Tax=Protea cynaroides TaxID=273540 RepID=A0A9Q0KVH6_9MAGN|nr:hypothetical protein NE237_002125 [Protea cynaroides]
MSGGGRDAVKVKIINTEYVYTDRMSFKSVVQKLTGKDAEIITKAEGSLARCNTAGRAYAGGDFERTHGVAVPSRGFLSQEEFDRITKEMPSMDEVFRLWGDS